MPEMDGIEATAAIRALETGRPRRMPIIAMTAHAMKGDRARFLQAGMDAYIAKPVQVQELVNVIEQTVAEMSGGWTRTPGKTCASGNHRLETGTRNRGWRPRALP